MANASFKKNPITTVVGTLFLLLAVLMYTAPIFMEVHKDFTEKWYIPIILVAVGVILVLAPDSIVRWADKGVNKKLDK